MSRYCKLQFPKHPFAHFMILLNLKLKLRQVTFSVFTVLLLLQFLLFFFLFLLLKGWFSYLDDCHNKN